MRARDTVSWPWPGEDFYRYSDCEQIGRTWSEVGSQTGLNSWVRFFKGFSIVARTSNFLRETPHGNFTREITSGSEFYKAQAKIQDCLNVPSSSTTGPERKSYFGVGSSVQRRGFSIGYLWKRTLVKTTIK
ncbi:unnamed protein product [Allacma fusca]|uniref:Uncharacterized protein n=1 Tax=Allacma fusca TaxID=39272 RepID=A0A8J2J8B8_9HEXA|nr:unnamed protein product [Allacma fusca]